MEPPLSSDSSSPANRPRGDLTGLRRHFRYDFVSGFLVFLIALPLCLGISLASGFPAIAGIFTAIVGAILCPLISNSELTIKGPAAGLIVIVAGAIEEFGGDGFVGGFSGDDFEAYRMVLAVGVGAALLQVVFGLLKGGILGEFFPLSVVHGMLAAIGVIIIIKQVPVALGVQATGEPLEMLAELPHYFLGMNPQIALIGGVALVIMFLWPWLQQRVGLVKAVPAALVVILAAVPLGIYFDLLHPHPYDFGGHTYKVGEDYLVTMPDRPFGLLDSIALPDFSVFADDDTLGPALKWVVLFFLIGTLESLLSAKAVDIIDPWRRKSNLDRDVVAVGAANVCSSLVGGLPMISEIVRSKANIDNGGRTRWANLWHGVFLLLCVALIPTWLHRIPLAALAAMLIYTGFRLTHPKEFLHVYHIGREQLAIFVATFLGVLATDLLWGIAIGIGVELLLHMWNGVPLRSLFKPSLDVELLAEGTALVRARHSAIFTNWILFRRQLVRLGLEERRNVRLDLAKTRVVDHSVMDKLHQLQGEFAEGGLALELCGLERHKQLSSHRLAARVKAPAPLQRITVIGPHQIESPLQQKLAELGAAGYSIVPYRVLQPLVGGGPQLPSDHCRIETIVTDPVADDLLDFLRTGLEFSGDLKIYLEKVEPCRVSGQAERLLHDIAT